VAADELRQPAPGSRLQARPRRASSRNLVDLHRVGESLDRHRPPRLDLDIALHEIERGRRQQDGAGVGDLLHPRGQVRGLADGRVVHVEVIPDGADHHLASIDADANLQGNTVRAERFLGVPLDRLLHPQGGVAGAHRVVFVGERHAEERHDPVAHDLVHRPLVAVDGLHHPLEHGIEELAGLFGIAIREELHRAFEVGEENGHLLPLAFQGSLGREDLLGEVFGGVRTRRRKLRRARGLDERRGALAAELRAGWVLRLAPGTGHRARRLRRCRWGTVALASDAGQGLLTGVLLLFPVACTSSAARERVPA
jgi:hypothetical protein